MIAAIDEKRVAVPRHDDLRLGAVAIVTELRAKTGFGPIAVMIHLLEISLLRRLFRVMLVRRITGPAAFIAQKLAHQQTPGTSRLLLAEDVTNPPTRVGVGRTD